MSVDETEETLTDPNNRIIKQITVEDINQTNILFDNLMRNKGNSKKRFYKRT